MDKIIFLDVDGPLINSPMFSLSLQASWQRTHVSTSAIGWLCYLAKRTDAKIVANSSHNYHEVEGRDLRDDLIRHGIPAEAFHENWRTSYPNPFRPGPRRIRAVEEWIDANHPANWVAFDDDLQGYGETWVDEDTREWHPRLVPIDFHDGITVESVRKAFTILGCEIPWTLTS